jgi:antimicrobial peptide system SdpA family protein
VGVGYAVLLATAGLGSLAATLPSNILWERTQLPAVRAELNMIAGENFAFFTRSPESEQIDAYRLGPGISVGSSLLVTPQADAGNWFGLSRTQRAQGPELASLLRAVRPDAWTDCTALDRRGCLADVARQPRVHLDNSSPVPTVCGTVVLSVERTTKWAYRHLTDTRHAIEHAAAADVTCRAGN